MAIDWQAFIFNPEQDWIGRMEKRARQRFSDDNIADEALNYALERLSADNWKKLQSFQGRSEPGTFLYTALNNQLEDFSRKKFGYPRPPAWISRLGDFWKIIWKRLCLERENAQVLEIIYADHQQIKEVIQTIKSRVHDCGKFSSITSIGGTITQQEDEPDFNLDDQIARNQSHSIQNTSCPEELNQQQCQQLLAALCEVLDFDYQHLNIPRAAKQFSQISKQLRKLVKLSPLQLHILKLRYQQQLKVSAIARILMLKEHKIRRELRQSEQHLLQALQSCDFELSDFIISE